MFSLEGRNAAIVGGGSGIGEAVAIGCAEQGAYVRCLDIDLDSAVETAATIKANPEWYQAYGDRSIFGRWGSAREMAGPTVFLASDAASYVTGTVLFADGGWTAIDGRFTPPGM